MPYRQFYQMHAISFFTTKVIMLKKIVPVVYRTADRHQKLYALLLNLALSRINSTGFLIFLDFLGYKWCLLGGIVCVFCVKCSSVSFQRRVVPFSDRSWNSELCPCALSNAGTRSFTSDSLKGGVGCGEPGSLTHRQNRVLSVCFLAREEVGTMQK